MSNSIKVRFLIQYAVIMTVLSLSFLNTISSFVVRPQSLSPFSPISLVNGNSQTFLASSGSTVLDKPTTKTPEKTSKKAADSKKPAGGWAVRLYNDPMNKREFVARCLSEICGLDDGAAFQCMMTAHQNGRSVIGNYAFEMAEYYLKALIEQGLTVDMIPLDDE